MPTSGRGEERGRDYHFVGILFGISVGVAVRLLTLRCGADLASLTVPGVWSVAKCRPDTQWCGTDDQVSLLDISIIT